MLSFLTLFNINSIRIVFEYWLFVVSFFLACNNILYNTVLCFWLGYLLFTKENTKKRSTKILDKQKTRHNRNLHLSRRKHTRHIPTSTCYCSVTESTKYCQLCVLNSTVLYHIHIRTNLREYKKKFVSSKNKTKQQEESEYNDESSIRF